MRPSPPWLRAGGPSTKDTVFSHIDFVMVEPSHPGNVGSAARALKTMGFSRLVLVAPQLADVTQHPDAVALASGAADVLEAARLCATLEEALADTTLAFALTARGRDLGPPPCDVREAATLAQAHVAGAEAARARVSMVVGTERSGLTNAHIALCHRICHIPANPAYSSLNVSQALQLVAWEMRYALLAGQSAQSPNGRPLSGPSVAPGAAVQAFLAHWEEALVAIKFLDPAHPKKLMPRMRHLFSRIAVSQEEVDMLRGVCTAMIATAEGRYRQPPGGDRSGGSGES